MGFEDIAYDLIKQWRRKGIEAQEKIELQNEFLRMTLMDFYYDWTTFKEAGFRSKVDLYIESLLTKHADQMKDALVQLDTSLSDEHKEKLVQLIGQVRETCHKIPITFDSATLYEKITKLSEQAKEYAGSITIG